MISGKLIPSHRENDLHASLAETCHLPKSCIFQALIKHVFNLEIGQLSMLWNSSAKKISISTQLAIRREQGFHCIALKQKN